MILHKKSGRLFVLTLAAGVIVGVALPASAAYSTSGSDLSSHAVPVALDNPATIGEFDTDDTALEVLDTMESGAETVTLSRLANGELATTVLQNVPAGQELHVQQEDEVTLPPPGITNNHPGPVEETVAMDALSETPSSWEPAFAYSASETEVNFSWYAAAGEYEVWEGGLLRAHSVGEIATVSDLLPGQRYEFQLVGDISSRDALVPSTRSVAIQLHPSHSEAKDGEIAPLTYQQWNTAVTYRTFIQPASVGAAMCNWGSSAHTFDGDGRGFNTPSLSEPYQTPNYRTLMFANLNWDNPPISRLMTFKNVGVSVTRENGVIVDSSYAEMDQMLIVDAAANSTYGEFRMDHSAANPHCKLWDWNYGGAIEYDVQFRMYRSGTVEAVGWRKPVPHHELYVRWNRTDGTSFWQSMMQRGNSGFHCLVDLCPIDSISVGRQY